MMDIIGSIGSLAAKSDLQEVLCSPFGSVDKMLEGKRYAQNARALRMLVEEILCPIFVKHESIVTMGDLIRILDVLALKSRTTKLWVEIIIEPTLPAIRYDMRDFTLPILTAECKLPYFAAGHHNYSSYMAYILFVRCPGAQRKC